MSRRFSGPRRGADSPPGQELLGVLTSHGPFRECYKSSRKSTISAEAIGPSASEAAMSAQRVRAALSSAASAAALLQRVLPGSGPAMVAEEGAAKIPGDGSGQTEAERAKPTLPGARPAAEPPRASGSWPGREGNHSGFFSLAAATGPVAMRHSRAERVARCNGSVRRRAGEHWSVSNSGSGAGSGRAS